MKWQNVKVVAEVGNAQSVKGAAGKGCFQVVQNVAVQEIVPSAKALESNLSNYQKIKEALKHSFSYQKHSLDSLFES